jgi:hypothetical protein
MLTRYLYRLCDTIISRGDIKIERLDFDVQSKLSGVIEGRLKFHDGSLLQFDEGILLRGRQIIKQRYNYHYQNLADELIFRYDNAPHHPHIPTILITSMLALSLNPLYHLTSTRFCMRLSESSTEVSRLGMAAC